MISRVIPRISRMLGALAASATIFLAVGLAANILARALTRQEIPAVTELSEIFFALAGALGFAYCELKDGHVHADAAVNALPVRISSLLQLTGMLIALAWLAWFVGVAGERAIESFFSDERRYGLYPVKFWPVRTAVAVGAAWLFVQMLRRIPPLARTVWQEPGNR